MYTYNQSFTIVSLDKDDDMGKYMYINEVVKPIQVLSNQAYDPE